MNHGGNDLITPYPRDTGRLVLAVDDRGTELRVHEATPGFWLALRWRQMHLGFCGAVAWTLTPREWAAAGRLCPPIATCPAIRAAAR